MPLHFLTGSERICPVFLCQVSGIQHFWFWRVNGNAPISRRFSCDCAISLFNWTAMLRFWGRFWHFWTDMLRFLRPFPSHFHDWMGGFRRPKLGGNAPISPTFYNTTTGGSLCNQLLLSYTITDLFSRHYDDVCCVFEDSSIPTQPILQLQRIHLSNIFAVPTLSEFRRTHSLETTLLWWEFVLLVLWPQLVLRTLYSCIDIQSDRTMPHQDNQTLLWSFVSANYTSFFLKAKKRWPK